MSNTTRRVRRVDATLRESQRRHLGTLSARARQLLGKLGRALKEGVLRRDEVIISGRVCCHSGAEWGNLWCNFRLSFWCAGPNRGQHQGEDRPLARC